MYNDPDVFRSIAKQRQTEHIPQAKRERLARSAGRSRRGRSPDRGNDAK